MRNLLQWLEHWTMAPQLAPGKNMGMVGFAGAVPHG